MVLETAVIIAIIAGAVVVVTMLIKSCYMSKCKTVQCGSIKIERDVSHEQSARHLEPSK